MKVKKKSVTIFGFLLGLGIVRSTNAFVSPAVHSPCPEIFGYVEISNDEWQAKLTLVSESDLHGVWVTLLTDSKMVDLVVSNGFEVKYNGTAEVQIFNREFFLEANTRENFTVRGKLIDGKAPELMKIDFNGETICISHKLSGDLLYAGDFNSSIYYSSIVQRKPIKKPSSSNRRKCGDVPFNQRIYPSNTRILEYNQYPWHATIFNRDSPSSLLCEATLISDDSLLTSAHCVVEQGTRRPIPGSLLLVKLKYTHIDEGSQDLLQVKDVIIHPEFNEKSLNHDLAIIKLQKSLNIDSNTLPACLPIKRRLQYGFLMGYGFDKDGNVDRLNITRMSVVSDEKCVKKEPLYTNLLHVDNFCAVYSPDTSRVCIGGSGSGFYNFVSERPWMQYEITGVVSIGRGPHDTFSCNSATPVVIVDTHNYVNWIESVINARAPF